MGIKGLKRSIDVTVAFCGLVVLSPIILAAALAIACTSRGGVLFFQERVGQNEVIFHCMKFRTMVKGTPNVGSHDAEKSWITPVGRILRRTKIDELPQLVNVLRGEMSLVGPRPCLPSQFDLIAARRSFDVFSVRPGITGVAQVKGVDMSAPWQLAELDASYLRNQSALIDLKILLQTVSGKGRGDAAARP